MIIKDIITSSNRSFITKKYIFEENNKLVENSFIDRGNKYIICISCMYGCSVGCKFCASGLNFYGLLTKDEMICIVTTIIQREKLDINKRLLISFMGSGEPSLNLNAIVSLMKEISNKYFNITFAISNSGVKIDNLLYLKEIESNNDIKLKLQFSLISPYDEDRKEVIPSTDTLDKILKVYSQLNFELEINYILLNNFNDSENHALKLSEFIKNHNFKLKINDYHTVNNSFIESINKKTFLNILTENDINYELYSTDGVDIGAACGQLISQKIN